MSKVHNKQFIGLKFFRQYSFGSYILNFYFLEKNMGGGTYCDGVGTVTLRS
jgi:hypothetical protein